MDDDGIDGTGGAAADRQAIAALVSRYCQAVDRLDRPLGYSIWHEDGVADYGAVYRGTGRGLIDFVCDSHLLLAHHSHQVTNLTIRLDGDRAASEAYATVVARAETDAAPVQMTMWVRYLDRWSRRAGCWGIDRRVMVMDLDEVRAFTSLGGERRGTRGPDDPSYAVLALD